MRLQLSDFICSSGCPRLRWIRSSATHSLKDGRGREMPTYRWVQLITGYGVQYANSKMHFGMAFFTPAQNIFKLRSRCWQCCRSSLFVCLPAAAIVADSGCLQPWQKYLAEIFHARCLLEEGGRLGKGDGWLFFINNFREISSVQLFLWPRLRKKIGSFANNERFRWPFFWPFFNKQSYLTCMKF